jgi:hypothetical protein
VNGAINKLNAYALPFNPESNESEPLCFSGWCSHIAAARLPDLST